jgi:hypothetical protein
VNVRQAQASSVQLDEDFIGLDLGHWHLDDLDVEVRPFVSDHCLSLSFFPKEAMAITVDLPPPQPSLGISNVWSPMANTDESTEKVL